MTSMGRQKTQMKMTRGTDFCQVALPIRRSGLFKKASELCTLCAVETALVIFPPGGRALSFARTDAKTIMNNLVPTAMPDSGSSQLNKTEQEATLEALHKEYHNLLEQLEAEKKQGMRLDQLRVERQRQGPGLIDTLVDELNLMELLTLKAMLDELQGKLIKIMQEHSIRSSAENSAKAIDPFATDPVEGSSVEPKGDVINPGN